jgi:iron complex transport system ATP-binding protein
MTQHSPLFALNALSCDAAQRRLLGPIVLSIDAGLTAILGSNGSGKSTLLQALAGLLPKALRVQGDILCQGEPLGKMPAAKRAKTISWLAQDVQSSQAAESFQTSLLTVQGLIELASLATFGWTMQETKNSTAVLEHYLQAFDLLGLRHEALQNISGGELQRAQLARVFAVQSPILLLDEPSNHLDLQHQLSLERAMQAQRDQASSAHACIYSTHDLNFALKADHLLLMKHGQVYQHLNLSKASDDDVEASLFSCFETPVKVFRFEGGRKAIRL